MRTALLPAWVGAALLATACMNAHAQTTTGDGSAGLGSPQILSPRLLNATRSATDEVESIDVNLRQTSYQVRQFGELPKPERAATPQEPAVAGPASLAGRPFAVDYVFLGSANVHSPAGGSVSMNEIGIRYQAGFPITDVIALKVRPLFDITFLDGPSAGDPRLPDTLFKLAADVEFDFRLGERGELAIALTPGLWSDFQNIDGGAFRLPARAFIKYRVAEGLYAAGGLIYTDNYYHTLLPLFGVIWDLDDRWRAELVAPRARIVYRFHEEIQLYTGVEGGGDTYRITVDGQSGLMQYRDLRMFVGGEVATWKRAAFLAELGFAFNRRFRVENQNDRNIDNAFYLRAGVRF